MKGGRQTMTIEQKEAVNRLKELVILRKSKNKIK